MSGFEWLYYIIVISAMIWAFGRGVLIFPAMIAVMGTIATVLAAIGSML